MPLTYKEKTVYTLSEVTESIRRSLADRYVSPFWVKAEMSKLNRYSYSGHCYPNLLEKKEGKVIAQVRANLWREDYLRINEQFLRVLKEPLKDDITILFSARVTFDPVYGLALRILDIEPTYALGELEREKQETIAKLHREEIFHRNKALQPAMIPKRIAVISVETSKGFADFRQMIDANPWGYRFFYMLFPSLLQGEKAAESIGFQLDRILKVRHHFDAVAIIRGGGGDIGLSGYNHYQLARRVALFPLPVITGVGHATNETVVEMVAHKNCITPTDLAGYLIQQFHDFFVPLGEMHRRLREAADRILKEEGTGLSDRVRVLYNRTIQFLSFTGKELDNQSGMLRKSAVHRIRIHRSEIDLSFLSVSKSVTRTFIEGHRQVQNLEKQVTLLDPINLLARGYTISLVNDNIVTKTSGINPGDSLKTITSDGEIHSVVTGVVTKPKT